MRAQKEMASVGQEGSGADSDGGATGQGRQAVDKGGAFTLMPEGRAAFKPPQQDVIEDAGGIEVGAAGARGQRAPEDVLASS